MKKFILICGEARLHRKLIFFFAAVLLFPALFHILSEAAAEPQIIFLTPEKAEPFSKSSGEAIRVLSAHNVESEHHRD